MAVLAERNDGNRHLFGTSENGDDGGIVIGRSGQGIGIENHLLIVIHFDLSPDLAIDVFEGFVHPLLDLLSFFPQMLQPA